MKVLGLSGCAPTLESVNQAFVRARGVDLMDDRYNVVYLWFLTLPSTHLYWSPRLSAAVNV
jgi:hypothetical protein